VQHISITNIQTLEAVYRKHPGMYELIIQNSTAALETRVLSRDCLETWFSCLSLGSVSTLVCLVLALTRVSMSRHVS